MSEYIEREALLEAIHKKYGEDLCFVPVAGYISMMVEDFYAADVVEVKHGRWQFGGDGLVACSVCEETYDNRQLLPRNYCPNCGAKMDGDRK